MLDTITRRFSTIIANARKQGKLTEKDVDSMLREFRVALIEADVNLKVTKEFIAKVREQAVGEEFFATLDAHETLIKIIRDELVTLLGSETVPINWSSSPPTVILLAGLQGSGKTTTAAKLANFFTQQGKKPVLAACDVQRPAAIDQLETLGRQIDVPVVADRGGNPAKIAAEAVNRTKHLLRDVTIVDTAGRLSIDDELMKELHQIGKAVNPDETWLVLDSTTGQEAVNVANAFHQQVPLSGVIFTKMDGDARGGAVMSVRAATGVPVRFVGTGEQTAALEQFHPQRIAERIIGMGDILGMIERTEQAVSAAEAQAITKSFKSGDFTLHDFLSNLQIVRRMGPLKNLAKMLPGVQGMVPEDALENIDEKHLDRIQAIVLSMTLQERTKPDILNASRKRRIAKGSGTSVQEINRLLEQFDEMRKNMKQMKRMTKKFGKMRRR